MATLPYSLFQTYLLHKILFPFSIWLHNNSKYLYTTESILDIFCLKTVGFLSSKVTLNYFFSFESHSLKKRYGSTPHPSVICECLCSIMDKLNNLWLFQLYSFTVCKSLSVKIMMCWLLFQPCSSFQFLLK